MNRKKIKLFLIFAVILLPVNLLSALPPEVAPQAMPMQASSAPGLIDLDVKDVDIKEIARIFSRVCGLNVVVAEDVKANVTFKGVGVEWETALNMILKTYNLTYVREGNFLRILTYAKLQQEEEGVPLVNKVLSLNFAKAQDLITTLTSVKSARGSLNADTKTNSLIIMDTPDKIEKILSIIKQLDKRTQQVMIEAMMVDVKLNNEDQLGIDWTITNKDRPERSFAQTLRAGQAAGVIQYGKTLLPHWNLLGLLDMWIQDKKAEILANPKILTLDSLKATIELVEQIPYTESTVANGVTTVTYSFRDVGIKMEVTPHISNNGIVSLEISTEQSYTTGLLVGGQPAIDKRTAQTNLSVADGETIVIGGLKKKENKLTVDRIPVLSKLPVFGRLFRRRVSASTDTELLIFITPYISTGNILSAQEQESLEKIEQYKKGGEKKLGYHKNTPFPLRAPAK